MPSDPKPNAETCRNPSLRGFRRLVGWAVLGLCLLLLADAFVVGVYSVPSGSMAPTLLGNHWSVPCKSCGHLLRMGEKPDPTKQSLGGKSFHYCPRCRSDRLDWDRLRKGSGSRVLVNKTAYLFRSPRRWEIVVFRLFGIVFIKRIVGLPGEYVEVRDGDVWIDGQLVRRSFSQMIGMRQCFFESQTLPDGTPHWKLSGPATLHQNGQGHKLRLGNQTHKMVPAVAHVRNFFPSTNKFIPIANEYVYNRQRLSGREHVHDFSLECDVVVHAIASEDNGGVAFGICDGGDLVLVKVGAKGTWVNISRHTPCAVTKVVGALRVPLPKEKRTALGESEMCRCPDVILERANLATGTKTKPKTNDQSVSFVAALQNENKDKTKNTKAASSRRTPKRRQRHTECAYYFPTTQARFLFVREIVTMYR